MILKCWADAFPVIAPGAFPNYFGIIPLYIHHDSREVTTCHEKNMPGWWMGRLKSHLVVEPYPLKNDGVKVRWDDDISYGKIKSLF